MIIKNLKLNNFRNYDELNIDFEKGLNVIYGNNAQGKTNIIESIFLCAIGKSFRTNKDLEMIKFDEDLSKIKIKYIKENNSGNIDILLSNKKNIKINDINIKKLSDLLGKIYIVLFSPDDIYILKGSPSQRRRFLNIMISELRPNYMFCFNKYIKTLEERNALLKQIKYENKSKELLDIYDKKLAELGYKIFLYRKEFINKINDEINTIHNNITNNSEKIELKYCFMVSSEDEYLENLINNRKKDIEKGSSSYGIHRDDFEVLINNKNVGLFGSQGQCRTSIISLKIAELQIIKNETQEYPILLLDDFLSELDEKRRNSLLKNIKADQIIITCTDKININNKNVKYFNIINGKLK